MKWLCGVGLRPEETGPIDAAGWLTENGLGEVFPLTVLEDPSVWGLDPALSARLVTEARAKGRARIERSKSQSMAEPLEVVLGAAPEEVLCQRAMEMHANVLIGRRAERADDRLIRLGRVARRVLRQLPGPVCVVPADADPETFGDGPVLVGVSTDPGSVEAIRFGRMLGEKLGREVVYVHGLGEIPGALELFGGTSLTHVSDTMHVRAAEALENFFAVRDVGPVPVRVDAGHAVDVLLSEARARKATAIVTGSRYLTAAQRLFSTSVGSTVAAVATVPVFVVPPA